MHVCSDEIYNATGAMASLVLLLCKLRISDFSRIRTLRVAQHSLRQLRNQCPTAVKTEDEGTAGEGKLAGSSIHRSFGPEMNTESPRIEDPARSSSSVASSPAASFGQVNSNEGLED